jgi:LmbE family N-acetylglucosaminyl deacetylase
MVALACLLSAPVHAPAQHDVSGAQQIRLALQRLSGTGRVLMIAAHPDDENTAVLAYFARGRAMRTAYLSLTRGEGGQNLIGSEQGALLGIIRTQELLDARRIDGAEQFFTRAIDFGFSKTAEETLNKWGHQQVLGDVVLVIRRFRPDVIILRFSGTPRDGHGHHQASAMLGKEAFEAAADPKRLPQQLQQGVTPWQTRRIFFNVFNWMPEAERQAANNPAHLMLDTGEYNPLLGYSYAEIAGMSRSRHRSQAFGASEPKGPARNYLLPVGGEPATSDPFEDIDTTWNRVPGGEPVARLLAEVEAAFDPGHPHRSIPALLKARTLISALNHPIAKEKLPELDETLALCAGLWLEANAEEPAWIPGRDTKVTLTALNRSSFPLELKGARLDGMATESIPPAPLPYNQPHTAAVSLRVPADQPYTQPFWLREPPEGDLYLITDQSLIGPPDSQPALHAHFSVSFQGQQIEYRRPVRHRYVDRALGQRYRPVVVSPAVSVKLPESVSLFPGTGPKTVEVQVAGNARGIQGELVLQAPPGWRVEPASQPFQTEAPGELRAVPFQVIPPQASARGTLQAIARVNGREVSAEMRVLDYPHIPTQTIFLPAQAKLAREDIKLLARRIGYVMGAGDDIPQALRQLGAEVILIDDHELVLGDLQRYDAIVTGVRAFNVRPVLAANHARLMQYVHNGGTLVVQYNVLEWGRSNPTLDRLGPYPVQIGRTRVSVEEAEVKFLRPDDPLLNAPNRITQADFEHWIQERGLYFAEKWDPRYTPLFVTNDPGEPPSQGGTLYARHGQGAYVMTNFSWFRQLPAGVTGAFRIFANLLSAGKVLP